MNVPSLTGLATETLLVIFGELCPHCCAEEYEEESTVPYSPDTYYQSAGPNQQRQYNHQGALFSLCLASRRLRAIAQPILYHAFMPGYGRSRIRSWDRRLTSFMCTVAQRRDLASLVKRIYIHPRLLSNISKEQADAALEQASEGLGCSLEEYRNRCREGRRFEPRQRPEWVYSELLGLMVALLPNLEHESRNIRGVLGGIPASAFKAAGVGRLSLKTVDISGGGYCLGYEAAGLLEMTSNSLSTLNLHMCSAVELGRHVAKFRLDGGALRLTLSRLGEEDLGRLLGSCQDLHTFVYEATSPPETSYCVLGDGSDHFVPTDAIKHLDRHRETLRTLYLDLRHRDYAPLGTPVYHPIPSLSHFTKLEDLVLTSLAICNTTEREDSDDGLLTRLLPSNIASLRIVGRLGQIFPRLAEGLAGLATAVSWGDFSDLKHIRCEPERGFTEFPGADLFASHGVDCGFESWPHTRATLLYDDCAPLPAEPRGSSSSDEEGEY